MKKFSFLTFSLIFFSCFYLIFGFYQVSAQTTLAQAVSHTPNSVLVPVDSTNNSISVPVDNANNSVSIPVDNTNHLNDVSTASSSASRPSSPAPTLPPSPQTILAEAEDLQTGFEVSPATVDLTLLPYTSRQRNISLHSFFPETTTYLIRIENYANDQIPAGATSAVDWFSIEKSNLQLAHKEATEIKVEVNVPASASPGDYYAAVVIAPLLTTPSNQNSSDANNSTAQSSQLEFEQRVAVIFNIKVSGEGDYKTQISSFKTTDKNKTRATVFRELPVFFNLEYQNHGTAKVSSFGELHLYNWFGQKIYSLNAGQFTTGPGETYNRLISLEMKNAPAPGLYRGKLVLQNNFGHSESMNTYFWFLPPGKTLTLSLVIIGTLIIIFGGFIWIFYRGFYQKWAQKRTRAKQFKKRRRH